MIASLSGQVLEIFPDSIVLDVGGVGFQIFIPVPSRDHLHPGESKFFFTYLIVRQDLLALYGFESKEERDFFILLLSVDGVGPKSALAVLSVLSPETIRRAVFHEQPDVFSRVPGIGKKTAQKILLQLQDRIQAVTGLEAVAPASDVDAEVMSALTTLGFSVVEAQTALQTIPRDAPQDVETRLRLALQYLS
ncbi:MAG: Holliday junction branch migration protein RuvA [Anaerolineales bacterium]|nr:Holliday junction branch migration protein RuvA [Anaerolineales bacterium]